ncbi:MAG: hypothetical protein JWO38_1898 [Gemmataceae bacterium]|nr:hypothetical protein [Gemmataceae bacterium]
MMGELAFRPLPPRPTRMSPVYTPNPYDPAPPPDRRWLRAGYLVDHDQLPDPDVDDDWVVRAVAYRKVLVTGADDRNQDRAGAMDPAVAGAAALRQLDPPLLRWAVEAYLLAGEGFDAVDQKCGLPSGTAAAYEGLHYTIRDRLDSPIWVVCTLLGPRLHAGLSEADPEILWKWVGFTFGPLLLDEFIHQAPGLPRAATVEDTDAMLLRAAAAAARRKEVIAAHVLPVTPATAARVLALWSRSRAAVPESVPTGTNTAPVGSAAVGRLLDGIDRFVGVAPARRAAAPVPAPRRAVG